ncbi:uncharacterized protein LOC128997220 [Macrosteles quadrilineatus]|uniref:uncharacterized protein LOC128997220 n=1 Tax=Macrosteles quadrilineatus TaxID=74068 RepID=UPI0023E1970F|nr:uncharacterized protein LOC128997220 [Macrosteles quadrilineatus]
MSPVMIFAFATLATLLVSTRAAPPEKACTENEKPCKSHSECCGGCCQQDKCAPYSDSCVSASNPCNFYDCPPNKECYLQEVQCLQSPCKPIPACRSKDAADYDYNG